MSQEASMKKIALEEIELMRIKLLRKSESEGRPAKSYLLLENFRNSIIGDLLSDIRLYGKDSIQTMLLFFTAIGFLSKQNPIEWSKQQLEQFTIDNYVLLKKHMMENNLSKNMGQRALPILLMLAEVGALGPHSAIELGASAGLIGRALIFSKQFINQLESLTDISPQFYEYATNIFSANGIPQFDSYLGIDLKIPDSEWNYYCIQEETLRQQYLQFVAQLPEATLRQQLIEQSAVGFSNLKEVAMLQNPVVITSMMLYQLPKELQQQLANEITSFLLIHSGYWANLYYSDERNRFEGSLTKVDGSPEELMQVQFVKGEGIEWQLK